MTLRQMPSSVFCTLRVIDGKPHGKWPHETHTHWGGILTEKIPPKKKFNNYKALSNNCAKYI